MCANRNYYVVHKQENLTRVAIHLGMHGHQMANSCSREVVEQVKSLVKEEVFCTPWATLLAIALAISKIFLFKYLLKKDGKMINGSFKSRKVAPNDG
jgi:hypothetical protein